MSVELLSREQIVNEGFKWDNNMSENDRDVFSLDLDYDNQYELTYYFKTHILNVYHIYDCMGEGYIFTGICNTIDDFRKIIGKLNLKKDAS